MMIIYFSSLSKTTFVALRPSRKQMSTEHKTKIVQMSDEYINLLAQGASLNEQINYCRNYLSELIANNDINAITWNTQLGYKVREMNEIYEKESNILQQMHTLFNKFTIGLKTFGKDFDPIAEGITESVGDEALLSLFEYYYQYELDDSAYKYDKKYDLQWYRAEYQHHMRPTFITSYVAFRKYMCEYPVDMNAIKTISQRLEDDGSFALYVCIVNDLDYMIPEELWPKSITAEQFERWFKDEHANVTPEIKKKLFKRIA